MKRVLSPPLSQRLLSSFHVNYTFFFFLLIFFFFFLVSSQGANAQCFLCSLPDLRYAIIIHAISSCDVALGLLSWLTTPPSCFAGCVCVRGGDERKH